MLANYAPLKVAENFRVLHALHPGRIDLGIGRWSGADQATARALGVSVVAKDVDFDRRARLRSVPAALGVRASLRVALLCHLVMLGLLVALYWAATPDLGAVYLAGVAAVALLLAYEHWLVRPDDLSRVNQAFFQVNGVISVGLFVVVVVQLAVGS